MRECVHARVCGHHERGEGVKVVMKRINSTIGRERDQKIDRFEIF